MGKITSALKKAAEERFDRIEKITKFKERERVIVKRIGKSKINANIVTYFDPKDLIAEQYKMLRTNILSMNKSHPPRTFVITSALHSEGKTVTSLNLAVCMAQAVHHPKVLLLDADLRRGQVHQYLGVDQREGLADVLSGRAKLEDAIFHLDVENLAIMSTGKVPENPAELLGSEKMRRLLSTVRTQFDFVIIDSPPVISVTDAGILGSQTDGVFVVIQAGRTQRGIIKRAEELITQSQSKILGHILTNIEYHLPEYIYRYL